MSRKPTKKPFDCLAFKRQAQAEIYEDIKGMTNAEQREYFRKRAETGPFGKWWKAVKAASERAYAQAVPQPRSARTKVRKAG